MKQTKFWVWSYGSVSRKTHFSSSFPGPLIVHGLPVSCPFNFPNGNLKQQLSHIGVFICYQNIDAKNKLNLHIYGIHLLNPHKTVVSHLNLSIFEPRTASRSQLFSCFNCLHAAAFILILKYLSLAETISLKMWERRLFWHEKCSFPASGRSSKAL